MAYVLGGISNAFFSYDSPSGGSPYQARVNHKIKYDGKRSGPENNAFYITNRFELGLHAGVGLLIRKKINIDLGGILSLTEQAFFYEGASAKNQVIQMTVGWPLEVSGRRTD